MSCWPWAPTAASLVSGREFGGSDTFATSQILAAAIKKIGVEADDIIFCGRQAIDGDTAQVGSQIAEKLGIPQISYAADVKIEGKKVTVKRMLEDGYMTIETQTPCPADLHQGAQRAPLHVRRRHLRLLPEAG